MWRKASLFPLCILFVLLLASCTIKEKTSPMTTGTIAPTANIAPDSTPSTDEVMYDRELATYITVEDGCTIADYADFYGEYYRCGVFHLRSAEYKDTTGIVDMFTYDLIYWEIVVLRDEAVVDVLRIENDEHGAAFPSCKDLVTEIDADFDGNNDLLLCLGHFGSQGAVAYKCWLTRGDSLTYCPSFADIANPALDLERKEVLSQWRNSADSHGYGIYRFPEDAFVMTERLTEQPADIAAEEIVWSWTDEIFVDGAWQVREYFTQDDYDEETLYSEKIYGDAAYWDIGSERWRSLYNNGKMSDFSIYDSRIN